MSEEIAKSNQAMLSVAGIERPRMVELCKDAARSAGGLCEIATELFPKGFSCAGTEPAIVKLKQLAESNGALQAKILKSSGAYHTELMAPVKVPLGRALDEMLPRMQSPKAAVYMNATGAP